MRQQITKWMFRLLITIVFIGGLLVVIVLNPVILYAHKTVHHSYIVYHNAPLSNAFITRLDNATALVRQSELYNPELQLGICLHDGSAYPEFIQMLQGRAFARGFYNKVMLQANADDNNNYAELNSYKWNLTQLLAHEMMHCYQYEYLGFRKSNPVANIPAWKWEGYPEYVARKQVNEKELLNNIDRLIKTEQTENNGWIQFADGTGTVITYYKYWLLMQYCLDVKKMTYNEVLGDVTTEAAVQAAMMQWYQKNKSK